MRRQTRVGAVLCKRPGRRTGRGPTPNRRRFDRLSDKSHVVSNVAKDAAKRLAAPSKIWDDNAPACAYETRLTEFDLSL